MNSVTKDSQLTQQEIQASDPLFVSLDSLLNSHILPPQLLSLETRSKLAPLLRERIQEPNLMIAEGEWLDLPETNNKNPQ